MARQDTTDFLAAFAVGTVLGIGATLLLRPEPRNAKERLMRELKPYRRKVRRSAARVAGGLRDAADATGDAGGEALDAGRELLADFREEVARILAEARDELLEAAEDRARDLRRRRRSRHRRAEAAEGAGNGPGGGELEVEVELEDAPDAGGGRGWPGGRGRPETGSTER